MCNKTLCDLQQIFAPAWKGKSLGSYIYMQNSTLNSRLGCFCIKEHRIPSCLISQQSIVCPQLCIHQILQILAQSKITWPMNSQLSCKQNFVLQIGLYPRRRIPHNKVYNIRCFYHSTFYAGSSHSPTFSDVNSGVFQRTCIWYCDSVNIDISSSFSPNCWEFSALLIRWNGNFP